MTNDSKAVGDLWEHHWNHARVDLLRELLAEASSHDFYVEVAFLGGPDYVRCWLDEKLKVYDD